MGEPSGMNSKLTKPDYLVFRIFTAKGYYSVRMAFSGFGRQVVASLACEGGGGVNTATNTGGTSAPENL